MEGPVNWASVDLLLSQLGDMLDPREDVDYLQEGIASLKSVRDEFAHTEETLRGLARGWLVLRVIRRRVAE